MPDVVYDQQKYRRLKAHMSIMPILQKKAGVRSFDEVFFVMMFLHETVALFDTYEANELENVAKYVELREFNEDEVIFKVGERSDGVYVLWQGAVSLYSDTELQEKVTEV